MLLDASPAYLSCRKVLEDRNFNDRYDLRSAKRTPLSIPMAVKECTEDKRLIFATRKRRNVDENKQSGWSDEPSLKRMRESIQPQQSDVTFEAFHWHKEIQSMKEQLEAVELKNQKQESELEAVKQRLKVLEASNPNLYVPLQLTREVACASLMKLLLTFLDNELIKVLKKKLRNLHMWLGPFNTKPFFEKEDVCYIKAWWFCHEILWSEGQTLVQFWKKAIGYPSNNDDESDNVEKERPTRREKSQATRQLAEQLSSGPLKQCEINVLNFLGITCEVTSLKLMRQAVGFYITMIKPKRNSRVHLFETLFGFKAGKTIHSFNYLESLDINQAMDKESILIVKDILLDIKKEAHHLNDWPEVSKFFLYNADGDEWLWNIEVSCTMQKQIDSLCNANAYWLTSFQCNPSVSHRYEWKFLKATTANIPAHILKNSI
ncbi:hypothetical protein L7F22_048343 [Adiantum nelumboides]|nr:hypothetical protein [Adiantum nelumboides]